MVVAAVSKCSMLETLDVRFCPKVRGVPLLLSLFDSAGIT